jgi:hypothetical protein
MAAARACLIALVVVAALFLETGAAEKAGNAARSGQQRRRQLLQQRKVHSHLHRLNKAPVASIEVLAYPSVSSCPSWRAFFGTLACQRFPLVFFRCKNESSVGKRKKERKPPLLRSACYALVHPRRFGRVEQGPPHPCIGRVLGFLPSRERKSLAFRQILRVPVLAFGSFTLKEKMLAFCSLEEERWRL